MRGGCLVQKKPPERSSREVRVFDVALGFPTMVEASRARVRGKSWMFVGLAAIGAIAVATPAYAANKSLPVAVASLPSDVEVIASVDATIARSTKLYTSIVPTLLSLASSAQSKLDDVKTVCGFDPLTAFDDVTIAVDKNQGAAGFIGVNVKESAFTSCIVNLAKQKGNADVTTTKSGSTYTISAPSGTYYFAWLPGDVIAFTKNPRDEKELARFTGGAGALASNKALTGWLSMADPNALAMAATTRAFASGPVAIDGGVASLVYKSGTYEAKATIEVGSKSKAEMLEKGASMVKGVLANRGPAELQTVLSSLDVKANGTQVVAKMSGSESDVSAIVGWLVSGVP